MLDRLGWWWISLLLLVPAPARAGTPARVVVDLAGRDPDVVLAQVRGVMGDDLAAEVRPLDEVLDAGLGPWVAAGPARLLPCEAERTSREELAARLADAERLIEELEFHAARDLLAEIEADACGSIDAVDAGTWARVPFLLGLAQFYIGDAGAAREAFRRAGERRPDLEWDTRFAPEPQQTFLLGLEDAVRSARVQLSPPVGERAVFLVDGVPLDPETPVELIGERHVLQAAGADGEHAGATLVITGPGAVRLRDRAGLADDLAAGPQGEAGAAAYATVAAAAQARGYAEVLVLTDPSGAGAQWYSAIDGRWRPAALDVADRLARAQRAKAAGGVLVGAGVATAIGGAALGFGQLAQATALEQQMTSSAALYDMLLPDYREHQAVAAVGFGVLAAGGVMVAAGIASANRGAQLEQELEAAAPAQVGVLITPTGVGVAGRF